MHGQNHIKKHTEVGDRRYGKYRKERKEHSSKDVYKQRRDMNCDSDAAGV